MPLVAQARRPERGSHARRTELNPREQLNLRDQLMSDAIAGNDFVRPFPRAIRIEPSGACNLACSHCPTGTVDMPRSSMPWDVFDRVSAQVRDHLDAVKVVVLYHGGEPLLHKRFVDMVRHLKTMRVPHVKTVSNGMILSDAVIEGIVDAKLDAIEFSLDGQSPEENNFVRRNCDAATVIRNIKRLIAHKRRVSAVRPDIFIASTQFLTPETHVRKDQPAPLPEYVVREFSGEVAPEITEYKTTWAMLWPHMGLQTDVYEIYKDPYCGEVLNYCDLVDFTMTIRWNGDVVTCCYDLTSQFVLGNVMQQTLEEIWNGKKYRGLRRSIDSRRFIPLCAACNRVKPNLFLVLKPGVRERLARKDTPVSIGPVPPS